MVAALAFRTARSHVDIKFVTGRVIMGTESDLIIPFHSHNCDGWDSFVLVIFFIVIFISVPVIAFVFVILFYKITAPAVIIIIVNVMTRRPIIVIPVVAFTV